MESEGIFPMLVHLFSYPTLAKSNIATFEKHLNILIPDISLTNPFWQSFGASVLLV